MNEEWIDFKQYIRKFPTCNLLEYFFIESTDIYKNHKLATRIDNVPMYNKKYNYKIGTYSFNISQWDLLEVCFYSIKFGNDNRSTKIDKNAFYTLLNKTRCMSEILEDASSIKEEDKLKHLICITNMEFDFETLNIQGRFNRLYYIMNIINNNCEYNQTKKVCYINYKKVFTKITNIDYDKYIRCYIFITILAITGKNSNLMALINNIDFDCSPLGFSKEEMKMIIKIQSKEYSFYRKFDNWNILKYYPIVHSQKYEDKYIITNIPALLISFSEFMYWTIRNYYNEINSRDFTTYFGHCFEFYLNDFFIEYNIKAKKIDENNKKVPDWEIETDNYLFIIEQKAGLYPIDTRSITGKNRIETLDNYLNNNFKKAFVQLNNYKPNTNKMIIRMCLTFEQIYMPELIEEIILPKVPNLIGNSILNWMITINEFEKLFILLNKDKNSFNKIIEEKISLEKTHSKDGRSFDKLLSAYDNEYINNKINFFERILNDELKILKRNN